MAGVLFLLCWHFHFQNIMQKKPVAYSKHVHLVSKISRLSNADKGKSLLIGVFSRDLFSFTSGVTEHFSTVPVKGREQKTHSSCFCLFLCGYSVSCCPSSLWNIQFQVFCDSEDSSLCYISSQHILQSLSFNKSLPEPVEQSEFLFITPYRILSLMPSL